MPKSFPSIVESHGGELIFTSSPSTITDFLGGPMITNFGGVCLALVMGWLSQNTAKTDPAKGIKNKTSALKLQNTMEAKWEGMASVENNAKAVVGKTFWYRSAQLHSYTSNKYGADLSLMTATPEWKESLNILCIYFPSGPGHALGVWKFGEKAVAFYDPNCGACVVSRASFREFLNEFLTEQYSDTSGYAICAFVDNP
jgi:hypothetical protein